MRYRVSWATRRWAWNWLGWGLVVVLLSGCTREPALVFSPSQDVQKLPQKLRAQIEQKLTAYFGTPTHPVFHLPVESGGEDAASAAKASGVLDPARLQRGSEVFNYRCAPCHGVTGDGNGTAAIYLSPKPRDFRRGIFKFTSTPYGSKPRRPDLIRTVRRGAKGTSMPAFRFLPDEDVESVVDYVIYLAHRGEIERFVAAEAADLEENEAIDEEIFTENATHVATAWQHAVQQNPVMPVSAQPVDDVASIKLGREIFLKRDCFKCHGRDGRGYTQENVGQDAWGNTVKAADLTAGMLHGGRRPIDVYRRIYSGINGTPMPEFRTTLAEGPQADPDAIWHLTHYILSIVEGRQIDFSDVEVPAAGAPPGAPAGGQPAAPPASD